MPWIEGDGLTPSNLNSKLPSGVGYNVRDAVYGAVGNGITDDTAAIQAAISAASTAQGGVVYVPPGVYSITTSLRLASTVALEGVGPEWNPTESDPTRSSILRVPSSATTLMANAPIIDVSNTKWAAVRRLKIMVQNGDPTTNQVMGIADSGGAASFCCIEYNHFQWFGGAAIKLHGNVNYIQRNRGNNQASHFIWLNNDSAVTSAGASDNFIAFNDSGAHQSNGSGDVGDALRIDGGANNLAIGNCLYNHYTGVRLTGNAAAYNRVEANRCEKNGLAGILIDSSGSVAGFARGNLLVGNFCFNNGSASPGNGQGISIADAAQENSVIGNYCNTEPSASGSTHQAYGILLSGGANRTKVSGNYCERNFRVGIALSSVNSNQITGNFIENSWEQGILVQAADTSESCNDNQIDGNYVLSSSLSAANTYDAILLNTNVRTTTVRNNVVRQSGTTSTQHAVSVNTNSCVSVVVTGNDLRGGFATAAIRNVGTTSGIYGNMGVEPFSSTTFAVSTLSAGNARVDDALNFPVAGGGRLNYLDGSSEKWHVGLNLGSYGAGELVIQDRQNLNTGMFVIQTGAGFSVGQAVQHARSATSGFIYVSSTTDAPSGTPNIMTGKIPLFYDTGNNALWAYNGSWRSVTFI